MLFLFWLGYAYVRNVHVRIDVFTGHLSWRRQAWLEILGIGIFAIPYSALATYYSWSFVVVSYLQNESSDAPNGLGYRWIIKGCLFLGLVLLDSAVLSVLLRKLVGLFGPPHLATRRRRAGCNAVGSLGDDHGIYWRSPRGSDVSRAHGDHVRGLSGRLCPRRHRAGVRRPRHRVRGVPAGPVRQPDAAHLRPGGPEPGPDRSADVRLHGDDSGKIAASPTNC